MIVLVVAIAGCARSGQNYFKSGIGANLAATDIARVAEIQNKYFSYLCQLAGLSSATSYGQAHDCNSFAAGQEKWTLIVHQGMNDIDRRCDNYLEWLDDRKRAKGPLLSQVSAVQNTTNAILGFAVPGSKAIEIVAQGFGLLTKSIENYHSRLILEIESSTINSVVLSRRHQFRKETADYTYSTKPAAEYTLRSYLRICLPFAIETEINDFSTFGASGVALTRNKSIHQSPASVSIPGAQPFQPIRPVIVAPARPRTPSTGAISSAEKNAGAQNIKLIQTKLCLNPDGVIGNGTRAGIGIFEKTYHQDASESASIDNLLDNREIGALLGANKCQAPFKNYYENTFIGIADSTQDVIDHMRTLYPEISANATFAQLRPFIARKNRELGIHTGNANLQQQITPEFLSKSGFSLR